jgi:hypothetical protein
MSNFKLTYNNSGEQLIWDASSQKLVGVPFIDKPDRQMLWSLQDYIHAGVIPEGTSLMTAALSNMSVEAIQDVALPFTHVITTSGYSTFTEQTFIPVVPGERLYCEVWTFRANGAPGTAGSFYFGLCGYDKNKLPLDSNNGINSVGYAVSNVTLATNGVWTLYSGYLTIPTSHTVYNGSDGAGCRFIRPIMLINYPGGTITTKIGSALVRRVRAVRDSGKVNIPGYLGIGTNDPGYPLHVNGNSYINGNLTADAAAPLVTINASTATNDAQLQITQAGTFKGLIGVAGSANSLITGSAQGDLCVRSNATHIIFTTASSGSAEHVRIDTSGKFLIGSGSARNISLQGSTTTPSAQIEKAAVASLSIVSNQNSDVGGQLILAKSRGAALGGLTSVTTDDVLGRISFNGADGSVLSKRGGYIQSVVTGTPQTNGIPAKLEFYSGASNGNQMLRWIIDSDGALLPATDSTYNLGSASTRLSTIYASNGTINTSDAREKTWIQPFTEQELAAASELAKHIGTYKFLQAVLDKGDNAPLHIGLTVQFVIQVMKEHHLDPYAYAFVSKEDWIDEKGIAQYRLGFRYNELIMFIMRAQEQRLSKIETMLNIIP